MDLRALVGAVAGGVLGALIWAGICYATGYEVGYVAWGIGALVGGGAAVVGKTGQVTALVCAVLALGSIFSGKMLAVEFSAPGEIREAMGEVLNQQMYDGLTTDAADFAQITEENDYPEFMVTHGYTPATSPDDVDDEALDYFISDTIPMLRELDENRPDYQAWREERLVSDTAVIMAEMPVMDLVIEDLGAIDILFALFGLATAYKIGLGDG